MPTEREIEVVAKAVRDTWPKIPLGTRYDIALARAALEAAERERHKDETDGLSKRG